MNHMVSKGSETSVTAFWDHLTDEELLAIPWYVDDPRKLPNLRTEKPEDLGEFQIELEYELDHGDEPVRCVHCPQHQRHWNGFVLKDQLGNRYCVGSMCGPKAYGADYRIAHRARVRAKRRFDALDSWRRAYEALPNLIEDLAEAEATPFNRAVLRARGAFEAQAPNILRGLRRLQPSGPLQQLHLSVVTSERDLGAEEERDRKYEREMLALASLPNREHARRLTELKARLKPGQPIIVTTERQLGTLEGTGWLFARENPSKQLAGAIARLRAYRAMGGVTQDKTIHQLQKLTQGFWHDLDVARNALARVRSAAAFFEPGNLKRMAAWADNSLWAVGKISAAGSSFTVCDHNEAPCRIAFDLFWPLPGEQILKPS